MESFNPLAVLDQPEIRRIVFYPRRLPETGKKDSGNLFFEVAPAVRLGCRLYRADKDFPVILFFHGNGEIATDYDEIAPFFLERRFNLLVTDYRGYGHSDGNPSLSNLLKDSPVLFAEVKKWLKENGYAGPIFIMGRSLGSLSAIEIALKCREGLAGLIVESGSATNFRNYLALNNILPFDHPVWEEGHRFFNKEKIREIVIPTLIIHAEYDSLIPLEEAKILFENSGAKDKSLVIIPRADHNDIFFADMALYLGSISGFVEKHLCGGNHV